MRQAFAARAALCIGAILVFLLPGCGSQVIPGFVVEGTTATIAIPYDFDVGFGRAWVGDPEAGQPSYDPSNPLEDLQRGEMLFTVYDGSTPLADLPVRYITRVARDPASYFGSGTSSDLQPMAFLEIPCDLVGDTEGPKDLTIQVVRYRRDPAESHAYVPVSQSYWAGTADWTSWGGSPVQGIPIRVLDSPYDQGDVCDQEGDPEPSDPFFTLVAAWAPDGPRGELPAVVASNPLTEWELDNSVPMPEFRVEIPDGSTAPFAWKVAIEFPVERMQVRDVRLVRKNPSVGVVTWSAPAVPGCTTGEEMDTFDVSVADPDATNARTRAIAITFMPVNKTSSSCNRRIEAGDVSIVDGSYTGYDQNGNVIAGASPFSIVPYDFH